MSSRRITPASVLIAAAAIVALFVLLLPRPVEESGPALDSRSMGLAGARGLYATLARLGYSVRRENAPLVAPLSPGVTYVVLAPATPVTAEETAALVDAVRRGATIVFTALGGPLTDSLGFRPVRVSSSVHTIDNTNVIGGPVPRIASPYLPVPLIGSIAFSDSAGPVKGTAFMWYDDRERDGAGTTARDREALVLGRTFGRGHAIAIAPADILSNQLLRTGPPAVAFVRALEWADAGTPRPIVFDEYHHGAGAHADPLAATIDALTGTALGRAALMALAAALVLLASIASRPIAPVAITVVQRRSPLEHVRALARAYLQSGADQFGTARLVHGLRRRHPLGIPRGVSDRVYLEAVRVRFPQVAGDAALVIGALDRTESAHITATRDAIASIEHSIQHANQAA